MHGEAAYSNPRPALSDWLALLEPLCASSLTVLSITELVFVVLVF